MPDCRTIRARGGGKTVLESWRLEQDGGKQLPGGEGTLALCYPFSDTVSMLIILGVGSHAEEKELQSMA